MTAGYLTGKYAFDTFSHLRGTLDNPKWVDTFLLSGRYPPYTVSYPFLRLPPPFSLFLPVEQLLTRALRLCFVL